MDQEPRTIRVRGDAAFQIAPDTTKFHFYVESEHETYDQAHAEAAIGNSGLQKALEALHVPADFLKTRSFSISMKVTKRKQGVPVQYGYTLSQSLALEQPIDPVLTEKMLSAMGTIWPGLEVKILYIKKDMHDLQLQVLQAAVTDARTKAETVANALGHKLAGFAKVQCDEAYLTFNEPDHDYRYLCRQDQPPVEYTPENYEIKKSVETLWYME